MQSSDKESIVNRCHRLKQRRDAKGRKGGGKRVKSKTESEGITSVRDQ